MRPLPDEATPGATDGEAGLFARSRHLLACMEAQRCPHDMLRLLLSAVQGVVAEAAHRWVHSHAVCGQVDVCA